MRACESEDNDEFNAVVRDHVKWTPFDKIMTKIIVTIKQKYCPE